MKTSDFKKLDVWKKSMDFACDLYGLTLLLPREERFGLSDQLRRAAISVPSNIAEGQSRNSSKEFIHFLSISKGSLAEMETQLILCGRLGFIPQPQIDDYISRLHGISRMIKGLMDSLENPHKSTPYNQPNDSTSSQLHN